MSEIPPRLLRETLGGTVPPDSSGCLDADTLAAWAEGTLRASARAAAESHASSCARCQTLLAAMARTEPEAPPVRHWRAWMLGVLTPLAAAAALLVWLNVPRMPFERAVTSPAPTTAVASVTEKSERASPAAGVPPLQTDRATESKLSTRSNATPTRSTLPTPAAAVAPQQAARADEERAKATLQSTQRQAQSSAQQKEARDRSADAQVPPRAEIAPPPTAADAAPPAKTANAAAAAPAPAAPPAVLESASVLDQTTSRLRAQTLAKAAVVTPDIVSPDANVRWRILSGGSVARSVDGGSTWQTQSTGVATTLTAGTAPTPVLCWLVGPRGTIVVSTDGRGWQRVPFPEAIELTAIRATDRANATVTAAGGRTFTTTDGGTTWR